jgi:hypothetical protein
VVVLATAQKHFCLQGTKVLSSDVADRIARYWQRCRRGFGRVRNLVAVIQIDAALASFTSVFGAAQPRHAYVLSLLC